MTAQEAQAAVKKYGTQVGAARALKCSRRAIQCALGRTDTALDTRTAGKTAGKTLADFRANYDKAYIVPSRVRAALSKLGSSGWEYEVAFAKLAGVSLSDLGMFREQFAPNIVALRDHRRAWAGSKSTARTMREML